MKKFTITTILILFYLNLFAPNYTTEKEPLVMRSYYEDVIDWFKQHEGFRAKKYKTFPTDKHWTIGYGYVITHKDKIPSVITKQQADSLIRNRFNVVIEGVKKETNLSGNQLLAISHFALAKGIGRFKRSKLNENIQQGLPIDSIIKEYRYFRIKGKFVESNNLLKNRLFELYCYGDSLHKFKTRMYE